MTHLGRSGALQGEECGIVEAAKQGQRRRGEEEGVLPGWGWEDREGGRRGDPGSEASGRSCWREGERHPEKGARQSLGPVIPQLLFLSLRPSLSVP